MEPDLSESKEPLSPLAIAAIVVAFVIVASVIGLIVSGDDSQPAPASPSPQGRP